MSVYGYARSTTPGLDRFFEQGLVIERAYATEANTSPSVVSILTGLLPQEHRVRLLYQLLPDGIALIPDLLPSPYQSAAFVANVVLTDEAIGIASHFDHFDDFIEDDVGAPGAVVFERIAQRNTDAALRWLRTERDPERPLFLWLHYIDPHSPYRAPKDPRRSFTHEGHVPIDSTKISKHVREPGVDDGLSYVDRYDEEIAYMDAQVLRLIEGYSALSPVDEALWVFTADHAESMLEHELFFSHGHHVYDEVVRVPFMLRGPGIEPGRARVLGSGIDVAPTILEFAGVEVPPALRGMSWLGPLDGSPERRVYSEATSPLGLLLRSESRGEVGYWRAVVEGDRKWMVGMVRGDRAVHVERVYALDADPLELEPDLEPAASAARSALLELIERDPDPGGLPEALAQGIQLDAPKVAPGITPEQRARLRALGYVE
jgi:arylsulfatase